MSTVYYTATTLDGFLADPDDSLAWLARVARVEYFEPDQVVFLEGETSSLVYVVAQGTFQVRLGEACKLVSLAEPGALFGEYAMFTKGYRNANVVAAEPGVLLSFSAAQFREFLLRCPQVTLLLLEKAVRRLQRVERQKGS